MLPHRAARGVSMAGLVETAAEARVTRAIESRYLAAAKAERQAALAASREALKPAPSRVGWNSRPSKADLIREKAQAPARAARAQRAAERRPAEDKALRTAMRERDKRWDHKRHATPATLEHADAHRTGALARLCNAGTITPDQLAASEEIAIEVDRIARDVTPRTASFETRIDAGQRGDGTFYEALGSVWRQAAYDRWRDALKLAGAPIGPVLEMIVGDWPDGADTEIRGRSNPLGYSIVARRWRMSARRAKALLVEALDLWWTVRAHVRREISAADVLAAHAGLL